MPWSRSRPTGGRAKHHTPAHRAAVKQAHVGLRQAGAIRCATPGCTLGGTLYAHDLDRDHLTDPRYPHLDHCPPCDGKGCADCGFTGYRGLGHAKCNRDDGARRARDRQDASRLRW
jgi:hypothetical protein